ncbi:uncharacterized protein LOC141857864 [Brevipalpus obovatus]|uniref:uncharacterized protein LOC141857864 n=1 Tax=Brevipalpus obovatus TaxID=246614 RepID=UPI003D9E7F69
MFIWLVQTLIISAILQSIHTYRSLKATVNPGCDNFDSCYTHDDPYLLHIVSIDGFREYHFVSSVLNQKPGFLISQSKNLAIEWDELFDSDSCNFGFTVIPAPVNYFGVSFDKIFGIHADSFSWSMDDGSFYVDNTTMRVTYFGKAPNESGTILINIQINSYTERYPKAPQLLFSPDSIHFEIIMQNFDLNQLSDQSISMHAVTPLTIHQELSSQWTLDFPPFSFDKLNTLAFTDGAGREDHISWENIVYLCQERKSTNSIQAKFYGPEEAVITTTDDNHVDCFNREFLEESIKYNFTIDFGNAQSSSSEHSHDFISWSFVIGLSPPPKDSRLFYYLLLAIILLSLSIFMIFSLIGYACKRRKPMEDTEVLIVESESYDRSTLRR